MAKKLTPPIPVTLPETPPDPMIPAAIPLKEKPKKSNTRKRTKMKKRQLQVGERYLKGMSQMDIAGELGISQATVCRDIKLMINYWEYEQISMVDTRKSQELARINLLEATYWDEWAKSREAAYVDTHEEIGRIASRREIKKTDDKTEISVQVIPDTVKDATRKIGRLGDPRYLQGVQWCIEQRCTILGISSPANILANVNLNALTTEQLERIDNGENIYQVLASPSGTKIPGPNGD